MLSFLKNCRTRSCLPFDSIHYRRKKIQIWFQLCKCTNYICCYRMRQYYIIMLLGWSVWKLKMKQLQPSQYSCHRIANLAPPKFQQLRQGCPTTSASYLTPTSLRWKRIVLSNAMLIIHFLVNAVLHYRNYFRIHEPISLLVHQQTNFGDKKSLSFFSFFIKNKDLAR